MTTPHPRLQVRVIDTPELAAARRLELSVDRGTARRWGLEAITYLGQGWYPDAQGRPVDWSAAVARAKQEKVSIPPDAALPQVDSPRHPGCLVEIANETSLHAARRMVEQGRRPLVLNLANGLHPGGGFRNGARAQEEYLCRSTALFATLDGDRMYDVHAGRPEPDSTGWAILSPDVPVFRDDSGVVLDHPWFASFISCAAPYVPSVGQRRAGDLLERRIHRVLSIARAHGYAALVLGAWGCGAFGNDPHRTAADFRRHLDELAGSFDHVVFAIADWSPERRFLGPFAEAFEAGPKS